MKLCQKLILIPSNHDRRHSSNCTIVKCILALNDDLQYAPFHIKFEHIVMRLHSRALTRVEELILYMKENSTCMMVTSTK